MARFLAPFLLLAFAGCQTTAADAAPQSDANCSCGPSCNPEACAGSCGDEACAAAAATAKSGDCPPGCTKECCSEA